MNTVSDDAEQRRRLEGLKNGAERFDQPSIRFVEVLLARAGELDGPARSRLLARAKLRLDQVEAAYSTAMTKARERLDALQSAKGEPSAELERRLAAGECAEVARIAGRQLEHLEKAQRAVHLPWVARMAQRARQSGLMIPSELTRELDQSGEDGDLARSTALSASRTLSRTMFREAASESRAVLAVARATDSLSDSLGPYNPLALSARVLERTAGMSPVYVRKLVEALEQLAALQALPEPPKTKTKRKRQG